MIPTGLSDKVAGDLFRAMEEAYRAGIPVTKRAELFGIGLVYYRKAAIVEATGLFTTWTGVSFKLKLREVLSIFGFTETISPHADENHAQQVEPGIGIRGDELRPERRIAEYRCRSPPRGPRSRRG